MFPTADWINQPTYQCGSIFYEDDLNVVMQAPFCQTRAELARVREECNRLTEQVDMLFVGLKHGNERCDKLLKEMASAREVIKQFEHIMIERGYDMPWATMGFLLRDWLAAHPEEEKI